ncbi:geranylgeranyl pyrophosphate synthase [Zopfochytrium polystomum]|nr:geranylgeranyl pyrophosphate synthase [Zopfochytrium polystomum]
MADQIASFTPTSTSTTSTTCTARQRQEQILLEPYHYLTQQGGKEIRTKLILAFDKWLHVPQGKLAAITEIVKMLHTASLIIDDVEDGSDLRRGIPVAHKVFGTASSINSANYVYFLALEKVLQLNDAKCIAIFTEELLHLHHGQGMEIYWRDNVICPSLEEYFDMIGNKTSGLLRLAVRLMQACSNSPLDCVPLVNILGRHFQIRDDLLNLSSLEYSDNKGFAEDLTEGKFSFLVIHSVTADPTSRQLLSILKQHTTDVDLKKYAISLMQRTGSFDATKAYLRQLERQALDTIEEMGGNELLVRLLEYLGEAYKK